MKVNPFHTNTFVNCMINITTIYWFITYYFPLTSKLYWKEKETHIHFSCYLYKRCINCVNESLFEMLNIHICTHCDTFLCKNTTCVSHFNGKGDRGYEREIQSVLNTRKNWFFKCPGFRKIGIKWKLVNVNINIGHENYANYKF